MSILDFKEIPSAVKRKKDSKDLDSFEKFAEEFFSKVLGAEIIEPISRGPDGGKDLIIKYEDDICLVSCKHNAHTGASVTKQQEDEAFYTNMIKKKCSKFIGFYSTLAHAGLINHLNELKTSTENNERKFNYEIFKSSDIESFLLDQNNAKGWLLAARYFPTSYSNLFQKFFIPVSYYKESDLTPIGKDYWQLNGPYGGQGNSRNELIKRANDSLTNALHKAIFYKAISDVVNHFPRYFGYLSNKDPKALSVKDISPIWDECLEPENKSNVLECNLPIVICNIWSLWDYTKANEIFKKISPHDHLGISGITTTCNGYIRELFARLITFFPEERLVNHKREDLSKFERDDYIIDWSIDPKESLEWIYDKLLNHKK